MSHPTKIRILRIIARLNIGGPAIQAVTLTSRLSDDFETRLVCGHVGVGEGDMSYLALSEGIKPEILQSLGREISPLDDFRTLRDLRKIIRDFKPDIIHTHTAKAGSLGRIAGVSLKGLAGLQKRARLIHTFHGHVFDGYFGPRKAFLFVQIERFLAKLTDRIVVISPLQFEDICHKYRIAAPQKVRIIPLGFDLTSFCDCRSFRNEARKKCVRCESEDTFVVGIVGRLTGIKNHRMFLDAAKVLKERGHGLSFKFLVVGDGELRQELVDYARKLEISDMVEFAGWHKDMPGIYAAMDTVALTSINEGTPVTLIEAMASGVPVIATDVGGVPDLLGPVQNVSPQGYRLAMRGVLIHQAKPAELADAIIARFEKSIPFETTANAREYIFKEFGIERLVEDMKGLYYEILQK